MIIDYIGFDERLDTEKISLYNKYRREFTCPKCSKRVEFFAFPGFTNVFCPQCKAKVIH